MSVLASFVDNYILILTARFGAPLSGDDGGEHPAWSLVSEAVQAALAGPRTDAERRQLANVDLGVYSPRVCRGRALYLKQNEAQCHSEAAAPVTAPVGNSSGAARRLDGESSFDITHDSLRGDVSLIYAAVRRQLPSAALDAADDSGGGGETEVERDAGLSVFDVFVPTPEEQRRDAALAGARDEFLSQVQRLQAAFFEKHRRWVDVPADLLDAPVPAQSGRRANGTAGAAQVKASAEEEERAMLLAQLHGSDGECRPSAADAVAALRRSVHVGRSAPRPSAAGGAADRDDTVARMYQVSKAVPAQGLGNLTLRPADSITTRGHEGATAAEPAKKQLAGSEKQPGTAAAPAAAPAGGSRRDRWQIVEYDDDDDDGDNDSDL